MDTFIQSKATSNERVVRAKQLRPVAADSIPAPQKGGRTPQGFA